jgi:hypothetical protein
VTFAARLAQNATQTTPFVFSDVILNDGGAYDPTTGVFSCPKSGVYYIIAQSDLTIHDLRSIFTAIPTWAVVNTLQILALTIMVFQGG